MNHLQIFKNADFGSIRAVEIDGEPWLVGKDVALALGYENQNRDIIRHVDAEDRKTLDAKTQYHFGIELGQRGGWLINESGLYSLVMSSKLPAAKKFKRWVTSEVLPAIRKNGGYITGQETMTDAELMATALLMAKKTIDNKQAEIERKQAQITEMQPKAVFADAVSSSKHTILVGELAKILRQNGVDTGEKRLFETLRKEGYLVRRKGSDYNMPTQRSMDMGLFEVKETAVCHSNGHTTVSKTPKVTGKGQEYFINRFLSK